MVGKKKFPYTKTGKDEAEMYAKKTGMKKKPAPKKKKGMMYWLSKRDKKLLVDIINLNVLLVTLLNLMLF